MNVSVTQTQNISNPGFNRYYTISTLELKGLRNNRGKYIFKYLFPNLNSYRN